MSTLALGIDFGTTNSSIARAGRGGEMELARFAAAAGPTDAYRSILYLEQVKERGVSHTKSWSGPAAIEEYLAAETKGRLIQSLKSFLTSRSLKSTEVFGRRMTLEELIARILRDLRDNGFHGYLSLELFNRDYWARSADENLKTAMEKIRATVRSAMA